ncbi:MAG: hypothetical protein LBR80_12775 [Deltaproteobacteria bacterium]|nr:hypothetical protein [Deltaproteobacteria bacterium]
MAKILMRKSKLLELIQETIPVDFMIVIEKQGALIIEPLTDDIPIDTTVDLLGMLKDKPGMSVDKYLELKHAERD